MNAKYNMMQSGKKKAITSYFNRIARRQEYFAAGWITTKAKRNEHKIVSDLLAEAGNLSGKNAIDAGCGVGGYIGILLEKHCHIIGIDIAPDAVRVCRAKYAGEVELILAELEQIPLKASSFDIVVCIDTLQYLEENTRYATVRGLVSLLKPGGTIILDVKNKWCPVFLSKRFRDILAEFYSIGSITNILREQGCHNVTTRGVFWPTFLSPIVVIKARKPKRILHGKEKQVPLGEIISEKEG